MGQFAIDPSPPLSNLIFKSQTNEWVSQSLNPFHS